MPSLPPRPTNDFPLASNKLGAPAKSKSLLLGPRGWNDHFGAPVFRSTAKIDSLYAFHPPGELGQFAVPANTSSRSRSTAGELRTPPHPVAGPPRSESKFQLSFPETASTAIIPAWVPGVS